ncbi:helix-turn-helix domain-containing protein [Limosilactobacillus antri]|uniref:helix-turn-helix domain-containing protein n=1 Tax=Limosilactobacillus antri TaxID=227943 RepID=UPI001F5765FF|nr:helix-turn-helix domain-containing protein [Limosilactobacillus antri]
MSENDSEQQIQIGKKLREARQAKGYTLDDLQQITKIQKRYLIAIEDEKFDELPGDFYVRAFIKQYADTVGLDGKELLREYDDDLPEAKTAEYSDHISQAVETRASQRKTVSNSVSKARQYLPTIIIACVIVVVLAAIWITAIARSHRDSSTRIDNSSVSVSGESRKKSSSAKKASAKTSPAKVKLTEQSRTATAVTYTAGKLNKEVTLDIQTSGSSTVRAVANNTNTLLNRTLAANAKTSVKVAKGTTSLVITVTNPAVTTIKLGGRTVNFTNNGKAQTTRTITINFGSQTASSSSTGNSTVNNGQRTTTNNPTSSVNRSATTNTTTAGTTNTTTTNRQQTTAPTTSNQGTVATNGGQQTSTR